MFSTGYLLIAVVDVAVLVWAARLCLQYRTNGLIFASLPLTLLWFDNFVIAIGGTLGEGELLQGLNTVRFLAHYIGLPMTFIALGAMAREAGFGWAQTKLAMGAFCALATGFIAHDLWLFSQSTFYPSCFADTPALHHQHRGAHCLRPDGGDRRWPVDPADPGHHADQHDDPVRHLSVVPDRLEVADAGLDRRHGVLRRTLRANRRYPRQCRRADHQHRDHQHCCAYRPAT